MIRLSNFSFSKKKNTYVKLVTLVKQSSFVNDIYVISFIISLIISVNIVWTQIMDEMVHHMLILITKVKGGQETSHVLMTFVIRHHIFHI
jgi:hypothetical protein